MEKNYKLNLEYGDEFITESTARRRRIKKQKLSTETNEVSSSSQELSDIIDPNQFTEPNTGIVNMDFDVQDQLTLNGQPPDEYDKVAVATEDIDHLDWADEIVKLIVNNDMDKENNDHLRPKDLMTFINSVAFSENISMPVDKSRGEIFFMILKFSILNSLSVTAMTNLFKLINTLFPRPILPNTRYFYDKILNPSDGVQFHALCPTCSNYVGEFGCIQNIENCTKCKCPLNLDNPSDTSFFVLIDPSSQISDMLRIYEDHYNYVTKEREHQTGYIEDVYDGKLYRKFVNSLPESEKTNYVSAVFNTDGAPVFKSSKYSVWPLFLKLNELPPQERMNRLITCGLYFSKEKPEMLAFIDKFVDLINNITSQGISCTIKDEQKLIRLYILSCCVDSVARAPIQGIKQFNGRYGCNWCLHPGHYAEGTMKYPVLYPDPNERSHDETTQLMMDSLVDTPFGIKYPSPLINLRSFDIISGFVPDYLHACLEGVGEQFTNYFLASKTDDDIKRLDGLMEKIAAPQQLQRLCRPLSQRKDYKAREWENFILYYSIPILSTILPQKQLEHWILFVQSLYILLKDKLHIDELNLADRLLYRFVHEAQSIYKIKAMSFNLHQLLHICKCVLNWGPLWTNSTFSFESANYYILKAIKCARGVNQQIVRYVNINHSLFILEDFVGRKACKNVMSYCNDILNARVKNVTRTQETVYFGKGDAIEDDMLQDIIPENSKFYVKIIKNRCLYEAYSKQKRRSNNSYAQLKDKTFIIIRGFFVDNDSQSEILIYNSISTKLYSSSYQELRIIESIATDLQLTEIKNMERICVFMNIDKQRYIVPLPNLLHY